MTTHLITSLSNASLDKFPDNSLTKFSHRLPKVVTFTKGNATFISLRSIAINYKLQDVSTNVGYIKVHLHELQPKTSTYTGDEKCLARIPLPPPESIAAAHGRKKRKSRAVPEYEEGDVVTLTAADSVSFIPDLGEYWRQKEESERRRKRDLEVHDSNTYWYEFDAPVTHLLSNTNSLPELNFFITDSSNRQLLLHNGSATVLNIAIQEMAYVDHFTVAASPYVTHSEFPANRSNDFRMALPSAMSLQGEWEVALHSVLVPRGVALDTELHCKFIELNTGNVEYLGWDNDEDSQKNMRRKVKAFLASINFQFRYNTKKRQFVLSKHNKDDRREGVLHFTEMTCRYLGFCGNGGTGRDWQIAAGRQKFVLVEGLSGVSLGPDIDHLSVYCDIVGDSIMGNALCPILETLSPSLMGLHKYETDTVYHVPHFTFRPLGKHDFSSIHFQTYTLDGGMPPILDTEVSSTQKAGVTYVLLLRKNKH